MDGNRRKIPVEYINRLQRYAELVTETPGLTDDQINACKIQDADLEVTRLSQLTTSSKIPDSILNGEVIYSFNLAGGGTRMAQAINETTFAFAFCKPLMVANKLGYPQEGPYISLIVRLFLAIASHLPDDSLAEQKFVLHISPDMQTKIDNFVLGQNIFDPQNVLVHVQPRYPGVRFFPGDIEIAEDSPLMPYGHGENLEALCKDDSSYYLEEGQRRNVTPVNYFSSQAKYVCSMRVNDMYLYSNFFQSSVARTALDLLREGIEHVTEMVSNPLNQKGGILLDADDSTRIFETLMYNGNEIVKQFINSLENVPYNRFHSWTSLGALKRVFDQGGLTYYLRRRTYEGITYAYLESVTDLVSWQLKTAGISSGVPIQDWKSPETIDVAIKHMKKQNHSPNVRKWKTKFPLQNFDEV